MNRNQPISRHAGVRKFLACCLYVLTALFGLMVVKTELRKWFAFGGEATPANTLVFWISLGAAIFFLWAGFKVWPHKEQDEDPGDVLGAGQPPARDPSEE